MITTATATAIHLVTEHTVTRIDTRFDIAANGIVTWRVLRNGRDIATGTAPNHEAARIAANDAATGIEPDQVDFCDTLAALDLETAVGVSTGLDAHAHQIHLAVNGPLTTLSPHEARALALTLLQHADRVA